MSSHREHPYLDQLRVHLPAVHLAEVERIVQADNGGRTIELVLAFVVGASCPKDTPGASSEEWKSRQMEFRRNIDSHALPVAATAIKRSHDDTSGGISNESNVKKARVDEAYEKPLFTLHAISASAPIRKKVEVSITASSIILSPPSKTIPTAEPPFVSISISSITRAFLVPTRGKAKPTWTVVLLSADSPPEFPKGKAKASSTSTDGNREIVFAVDADAPAGLSTAGTTGGGSPVTVPVPKGTPTLPVLEKLLGFFSISVIRPSATIFRGPSFSTSTKSRPSGSSARDEQDDTLAGVDAHRGAKSGSLWFLDCGLLWTDVRPAEFWSLEDILPAPDGVRMLSATGRTCSVFVTRRAPKSIAPSTEAIKQDEDEDMEDTQEEGIETEFALIDGKEQDAINTWVKRFGPRFGKTAEALSTPSLASKDKGKTTAPEPATGKVTIMSTTWEDDDDEDEDFEGSDDSQEDGGADHDGSEEAASNDAESGSSDEDEDGGPDEDAESEGEDEDEEEEKESLDPAQHPLLRPGGMPKKVSKAVIDMVAEMVSDQMLGGEEEDELDELEE